MNKMLLKNSLFICFAFLFSSCAMANQTGDLKFKNFYKEANTHLLGKSNAPKAVLKINVEYPTTGSDIKLTEWVQGQISSFNFGKKFADVRNQKALCQFSKHYANYYLKEVEPMYKDDLEQSENKEDIGHWYNYEITLDSKPTLYSGDILVIESLGYEYTGGAHGMPSVHYLNLDLSTQKQITFDDLFRFNAEETLRTLIIEQLQKDAGTDSLQSEGYWVESIKATKNIRLTETGVTFVYNVYEIAPYVMGPTEVNIPYDKLQSVMNSDLSIPQKLKL